MFKTQLAQIAAAVPIVDTGKIPRQSENPVENVSLVATGWGNRSGGHLALTIQRELRAQEQPHGEN
jgi:uncharacterized protein YcfJ